MSAITVENDLVHYEVLGRGRPVIFVHGWLGSWRYWVPTMQQLSEKYRTYALDLWGYGDSGKFHERYGLAEQVKLLYDFMEKLGIAKAALVGHSLGAAVCLRFAGQYADRAPRLVLVSPPLTDTGSWDAAALPAGTPVATTVSAPTAAPAHAAQTIVRNPFKGMGESPEEILARLQAKSSSSATQPSSAGQTAAAAKPNAPALPAGIARTLLPTRPGEAQPQPGGPPAETVNTGGKPAAANRSETNVLAKLTGAKPIDLLNRYISRDAPDLDKLRAEVEKTDETAIAQSVQSFAGVNLAAQLHYLPSPTLLLHGAQDPVLPPPAPELLSRILKGKADGQLLALIEEDLRHFPMLEITPKFNRLLMNFFEATDLKNIQFKDQWRRTMR
jgi:pimeloyl-ACP methyl ester carboxylesterase